MSCSATNVKGKTCSDFLVHSLLALQPVELTLAPEEASQPSMSLAQHSLSSGMAVQDGVLGNGELSKL